MIQSLVLFRLDYCPTVRSNASKQELNKIQLAQNRAARQAVHCSLAVMVKGGREAVVWSSSQETFDFGVGVIILCSQNKHKKLML